MGFDTKIRLIKALKNDRIVLFWEDLFGEQVSPDLASIPRAQEWWNQFQHQAYKGPERRASSIDRRKLSSRSRYTNADISQYPDGRRATDTKLIEVEVDRTVQQLEWFQKLLNQRRWADVQRFTSDITYIGLAS